MALSEELSERILTLKNMESSSTSGRNYNLRNEIIRRIRREHPELPCGRVYALAFSEFLAEKDICIFDEELLAGHI